MDNFDFNTEEHSNRTALLFLAAIVSFVLGALLWPYIVNSWFEYFNVGYRLVWWQGGILAFVPLVGKLTIPLAIVTFILMSTL